ncbi:hypothetical protein AGLY_000249 [Aphis glycines]|uniref:Uncharacterized protein n=1 Tax=Aphis glycines TaxID=307491 RepID=A0A6G0U6X8_APHGL|nr:hypothetical protein AGLY_000249 [Aphis glycines]
MDQFTLILKYTYQCIPPDTGWADCSRPAALRRFSLHFCFLSDYLGSKSAPPRQHRLQHVYGKNKESVLPASVQLYSTRNTSRKKTNIAHTAHVLRSPQRAVLHVLVVPDRRHRVSAVRARVVVVGPDRFAFGGLHPRPVPGRRVVLATVHLRLDDVLFQLVDDVLQQFTPDVLRVLRNYHTSRHAFKEEIKTFLRRLYRSLLTRVCTRIISHNDIWLAALTPQNVRNTFHCRKNRLYFDKRLTSSRHYHHPES